MLGGAARWAWLAYLALRCALLFTPGYGADIGQFKLWSLLAAEHGVARLYESSDFDYPPLYAYVLGAIGRTYDLIEPDALARRADSAAFTALVKLPALLFDLLIAGLLLAAGRAAAPRPIGPGGRAHGEPGAGPAAAYLLNPGVLFVGACWGQPDAVHSFFAAAAFAALPECRGARRPAAGAALAWSLLALAALMKPLGAPYFPLLALIGLLAAGARATLLGACAAAAVAAVVALPFVVQSGLAPITGRLLRDLGLMAWTSVQAHNLWWIVGPWRDAEAAWIGGWNARQAGIALFLAFLAALCARAWIVHRARRAGLHRSQSLALAGALGFGFFMLSTHMHENHAFAAVPLLLAAIAAAPRGNGARRLLAWLVAAVSAGLLLNCAAHDPWLRERWPLALGGPSGYAGDAPGRTFLAGEWIAGWIGTIWNLLAFGALCVFTFGEGLRRLAWRPGLPDGPREG